MGFKSWLIGIIVIAGLMTGIVILINDLNDFYKVSDTSNAEFYSAINTTEKSTTSFVAGFQQNTTNKNFISGLYTFGSGVISAILSIKDSTQAGINLIGYSEKYVTKIFPDTFWIFTIAIGIIIVFITYVVLNYMTRVNP